MIVHAIHLSLLAFGFVMSILLLLSIFRGTPKNIRNYAVLLFWLALNDVIAIVADAMSMERCTFLSPSFVFIAVGPCTKISLDFCNYCDSFFCGTTVQSTIIQCISFWYRLRILSKPAPGALAINAITFALTIPNAAHMVFFKHIKSYDPLLLTAVQTLYPEENFTSAYLYGLTDIFEPSQALAFGYFFAIMPVLFTFLIIVRSKVVHRLHDRQSMSEKTYAMHLVFLKILTIHALLPLTIIIACGGLVMVAFGYMRNPEFEALLFMTAMIPPVVNPAVTIWYMKPYRAFVTRLLCANCSKYRVYGGSSENGARVQPVTES